MTQITLGDISVDVIKKDIKNVHLSVHPPTGRVRISAPQRMSIDTIRVFAVSKLAWIKHHQQKVQTQERETPREYLDRESHYVWGRRYLLRVVEDAERNEVTLSHNRFVLSMKPGTPASRRVAIVDEWYRHRLKEAAAPILLRWEKLIGVKSSRLYVQRMKTRWGSCNHDSKAIRLNSELAKKPQDCLEYIVVHELLHLIEPTHNRRFTQLLEQYMPDWQHRRDLLNRLPVRYENWKY
jgi:predicted metal-dependent hydrolase